jgi:hypothetical protein
MILPFDEVRHRVVVDAIDKCGGNYMLAARMLGIGKTTIYRWVRIYGYEHPKDQAAVLLATTRVGIGLVRSSGPATNARRTRSLDLPRPIQRLSVRTGST